jgi:four helix bundle protein
MVVNRFEDLIAWQKSKQLTLEVYRNFYYNKDYGFKDQIQRAAISIGNNIAEGFERRSNREFKQFLYIAKGSCGEVRSMSYIALDLKYINQDSFCSINNLSIEIAKIITGLIKSLNF